MVVVMVTVTVTVMQYDGPTDLAQLSFTQVRVAKKSEYEEYRVFGSVSFFILFSFHFMLYVLLAFYHTSWSWWRFYVLRYSHSHARFRFLSCGAIVRALLGFPRFSCF